MLHGRTLIRGSLLPMLLLLPILGVSAQRGAAPETADPLAGPDGEIADGGEVYAAALPANFLDEVVVTDIDRGVGICFASDGRVYMWEKGGVVWIVENEVKSAQPFLDISEEVGNWGDHGMLGFALDPDFYSNGYVYVMYVVDYHHLTQFGLPSYDPLVDEYNTDTIGRITRYTANAADGFRSVDPASRLVLVGESISTGIPVCSNSHGVGYLVFGEDGSLLASTGDGDAGPTTVTCLSDGIIRPEEDVGKFRAQLVDSLSGKVLRLDPATGDGLPSNPWYDPLEPRAARSRVWCVGLRNPCRMSLHLGTGSFDPALGDPGHLFLGDVGSSRFEEIDVARTGGLNFGWPIYEGLDLHPLQSVDFTPNLDAPNPEFGNVIPGIGLCTQEDFDFQDLLVQDTQNAPFWGNPCDPGLPIVSDQPVFVHSRPVIEFDHDGGANVPVFDAFGEADSVAVGAVGSPVTGDSFGGRCSLAGAFYGGTAFPEPYQGSYFHIDFAQGWIHNFVFDGNDELLSTAEWAIPVGRPVSLDIDPVDGSLWYMDYTSSGQAMLHRVTYVPGDLPPDAIADSDAGWGAGPIVVQFDGTRSSDPEGTELTYEWDFGDGTPPSRLDTPTHQYPIEDVSGLGTFTAKVFELDPPMPMGTSNPDPEVMRDDVYPPFNGNDSNQEWSTAHWDENLLPDKGGEDWVGYEFSSDFEFVGLFFQEGRVYASLGGWWNYVTVEVRQGGVWTTVEDALAEPPYPGDILFGTFEFFDYRFAPVVGDGIRLYGIPGGTFEFVTIGELRVLATPANPVPPPTNYDVGLVVTDAVGNTDSDDIVFSLNNTPPSGAILTPKNFGIYSTTTPDSIVMRGTKADTEQPNATLGCAWQIILHHEDHTHPGEIVTACLTTGVLGTDGCPELHYYEILYEVTDDQGLTTSVSHFLTPDCDLNHNGQDDQLDILTGVSFDVNLNGVPDEAERDCNDNGIRDVDETFYGYTRDSNGNLIPDECESFETEVMSPFKPVPPPGS